MILAFTLAGVPYPTAAEAVRAWEALCERDRWWERVRIGIVLSDRETVFVDPRALKGDEKEVGGS